MEEGIGVNLAPLHYPKNLERLRTQLAAIDVGAFPFRVFAAGTTAGGVGTLIQSAWGIPADEMGHWSQYKEPADLVKIGFSTLSASALFSLSGLMNIYLENQVKYKELKRLGINYQNLSEAQKNQLGEYKPADFNKELAKKIGKHVFPTILLAFTVFTVISEASSTAGDTKHINTSEINEYTLWSNFFAALFPTVLVGVMSSKKIFDLPVSLMHLTQIFASIPGLGVIGRAAASGYSSIAAKLMVPPAVAAGMTLIPPVVAAVLDKPLEWTLNTLFGRRQPAIRSGYGSIVTLVDQDEKVQQAAREQEQREPSSLWYKGIGYLTGFKK